MLTVALQSKEISFISYMFVAVLGAKMFVDCRLLVRVPLLLLVVSLFANSVVKVGK
jgi:hypothetical protein